MGGEASLPPPGDLALPLNGELSPRETDKPLVLLAATATTLVVAMAPCCFFSKSQPEVVAKDGWWGWGWGWGWGRPGATVLMELFQEGGKEEEEELGEGEGEEEEEGGERKQVLMGERLFLETSRSVVQVVVVAMGSALTRGSDSCFSQLLITTRNITTHTGSFFFSLCVESNLTRKDLGTTGLHVHVRTYVCMCTDVY